MMNKNDTVMIETHYELKDGTELVVPCDIEFEHIVSAINHAKWHSLIDAPENSSRVLHVNFKFYKRELVLLKEEAHTLELKTISEQFN